jgi:hypothetical protein
MVVVVVVVVAVVVVIAVVVVDIADAIISHCVAENTLKVLLASAVEA